MKQISIKALPSSTMQPDTVPFFYVMTSTVCFKLPVYVCLRIVITVMSCHVHLGLWLFVIFVFILFLSLSFKEHYQHLSAPISIFFLNHSPRTSCLTCVFTFLSFCLVTFTRRRLKPFHCFAKYCRPSVNLKYAVAQWCDVFP